MWMSVDDDMSWRTHGCQTGNLDVKRGSNGNSNYSHDFSRVGQGCINTCIFEPLINFTRYLPLRFAS